MHTAIVLYVLRLTNVRDVQRDG